MPWNIFQDDLIQVLENALTWRSRRHEIIAANVANLDTPHYTRKDMDFDTMLKTYLAGGPRVPLDATNPIHLTLGGALMMPGQIEDTGKEVDIDNEMMEMAVNQLAYQTSVQVLNKKLDSLRTVIEGDRR